MVAQYAEPNLRSTIDKTEQLCYNWHYKKENSVGDFLWKE